MLPNALRPAHLPDPALDLYPPTRTHQRTGCPPFLMCYNCFKIGGCHLRYNESKEENDTILKGLEDKREQFKKLECKDIKLREDLKHLNSKSSKTQQKMSKDDKKMKVCQLPEFAIVNLFLNALVM